jgi:hypothetical protein
MSTPAFRHAIEIAVPRAVLHAFLSELENFASLHPLIESIRALPARADRPRARHYRVVDRIPVGPIRLRTVYTATLDPVAQDEIHGEAWQAPGVHLLSIYRLEDRGASTGLVEEVLVDAPFGLRRFVTRQARDAHRATLEKMKVLLEGAARSA